MRQLPQKVSVLQEKRREKTSKMVQDAIDELTKEGFDIKRKDILERTGLSNSVLSKPHVIEVLRKNKVCQFAIKKKLNIHSQKDTDIELKNAYEKISRLENKVKDLDRKLATEKNSNHDLKDTNELLRGQLHLLVKKARLMGFVIDNESAY